MTELRIERTIPVPPHAVWDAFTVADRLAEWLWPESWSTEVRLDLRVGGAYRISSPVTGMAVSGNYSEIETHHRLAFTWVWEGEPAQTHVTIDFEESPDGGTAFTLDHLGFADPETRNDNLKGWNDCLDRLPRYFS